jgi:AbrB family looped-hinge helix DNA binding protein
MVAALAPAKLDTSRIYNVRLRQRGQITMPREVRDRLNVSEGDTLTLVQMGSILLLTPERPVVPLLADRIVELMETQGVTLADLLIGLEEERAAIYQERWSQKDERTHV